MAEGYPEQGEKEKTAQVDREVIRLTELVDQLIGHVTAVETRLVRILRLPDTEAEPEGPTMVEELRVPLAESLHHQNEILNSQLHRITDLAYRIEL